jgi:glucose-1-phosphate adenylyltransferase
MPDQKTLSIILGGGRGTRLYPLTKLRAKPAVPLAGRYRLIDIPISNCINSGINRVFVLTQFLSTSLARHIYETYKFDIFSKGFVELLPAEQTLSSEDWYQGTADAVRRQLHRISSRAPDHVLILAGDHLYRTDYRHFLDVHVETGADVTIGVLPIPSADAPRFGVLQTDEQDHIVRFAEKPSDQTLLDALISTPGSERPHLGSMGIYVFRREALEELLASVDGTDFGKHIIPAAIERMHVHAWRFDSYWEDIGTIASFYEANLRLTRHDRPFGFHDRRYPIYTRPRFLPGSQVAGSTIDDALIGDGCRLNGAEIRGCVIGQRSMVRRDSVLEGVVMLGADWYEHAQDQEENERLGQPPMGIGRGCHISRAIIDKNARIGDGVVIASHAGHPDRDDPQERWFVRDGVVVVPKDTIIPPGTRIEP